MGVSEMVTVMLDGSQWNSSVADVRTMSELVELIKANIDPEKIVTSMSINGQDLTEGDWRAPLSVQGSSVLEITTGSVKTYVNDRLNISVGLVETIIEEFKAAREQYQKGGSRDGNVSLSKAVSDLRAFLDWFYSILSLAPVNKSAQIDSFKTEIDSIGKVCEQLLQQQLYQSWWALGQTIQAKLEPKLADLRDFCGRCIEPAENSLQ